MRTQIAGPGCPDCQTTEKKVFNACTELNLPADIYHVYNAAGLVEFTGLKEWKDQGLPLVYPKPPD